MPGIRFVVLLNMFVKNTTFELQSCYLSIKAVANKSLTSLIYQLVQLYRWTLVTN